MARLRTEGRGPKPPHPLLAPRRLWQAGGHLKAGTDGEEQSDYERGSGRDESRSTLKEAEKPNRSRRPRLR